MRRLALLAATIALAAPAAAQADSCAYDAATGAVTGDAGPALAYGLRVSAGAIEWFPQGAADWQPCGAATGANTQTIRIDGASEYVALHAEDASIGSIRVSLTAPVGQVILQTDDPAGARVTVSPQMTGAAFDSTGLYNVTWPNATVGVEFFGGPGADSFTGAGEPDIAYGRDGNDTLSGGGNIDDLFGDAGADTITGGAGVDKLRGGRGADRIDAVDGEDDDVGGGKGKNTVMRDPGMDRRKSS